MSVNNDIIQESRSKYVKIDQLALGSYQTNCYILRADEVASDCLIIDTGLEADGLIEFLQDHKLNPVAAIFTHGHSDHIGGLAALHENQPGIEVCIHKLDADSLTNTEKNLSALAGVSFTTEPADILLEEGGWVEYAGIRLKILHTPGHTPGGICLYSEDENLIFTGDTLFAGSVGRTDFPYADHQQLLNSLREKILPLPDKVVAYPGHGPKTTIGNEKKFNPFLQGL